MNHFLGFLLQFAILVLGRQQFRLRLGTSCGNPGPLNRELGQSCMPFAR